MSAAICCEDVFEAPGEWGEYMDGDLSCVLDAPATGTDWRTLPPWEFVAIMDGACPEEQQAMELSAFGQLYGYQIVRFWYNDWSEMLDSFGGDPARALWDALMCTDVILARDEDGGWTAVDHKGRLPAYHRCGRVAMSTLFDCAGAYPSYRMVYEHCGVAHE